jgi:hypothetical protein
MWASEAESDEEASTSARTDAPEVCDLLGSLVDEEHDEVDLGMVLGYRLPEVLQQRRLARLGRRDDEAPLAAPDGSDQIDHRRLVSACSAQA